MYTVYNNQNKGKVVIMSEATVINDFKEKFLKISESVFDTEPVRILMYGSSNTEHIFSGMHWSEVFDFAIKSAYGRVHRTINCGIGGDTSQGLLGRFSYDAEFYKPHMVFITIGGNDSNPDRKISPDDFRNNLLELHKRFTAINCKVFFQTYYAADKLKILNQWYYDRFMLNMQITREVAEETGSGLVDHNKRWERFRVAHPAHYKRLMKDAMHVNYRGNMVMGIDMGRKFGVEVDHSDVTDFWDEAFEVVEMMDKLEAEDK